MYQRQELVGHWLNCRFGWGRRVVKLLRNIDVPLGQDGAWTLYVEIGTSLEGGWPYRTEARAREDIGVLLSDPQAGPFRLVGGTEHDAGPRSGAG